MSFFSAGNPNEVVSLKDIIDKNMINQFEPGYIPGHMYSDDKLFIHSSGMGKEIIRRFYTKFLLFDSNGAIHDNYNQDYAEVLPDDILMRVKIYHPYQFGEFNIDYVVRTDKIRLKQQMIAPKKDDRGHVQGNSTPGKYKEFVTLGMAPISSIAKELDEDPAGFFSEYLRINMNFN
jgi:hypothetical protein